jgi:hypothetical protein
MARTEPSYPLVVLAASAGGGALLAHALSGHAELHGFDDGGLCAALLGLPAPPGGPAPEGISALSAERRTAAVETFAGQVRRGRGPAGARAVAPRLIEQVALAEASAAGKPSFAIHAAGCIAHADAVAELFPQAVIVHLIRDGRAVALTRAESAPSLGSLGRWAEEWLAEIGPALSFEAAHPERVIKVAYEDLLIAPHAEFEKLCLATERAPQPDPMAERFRAASRAIDLFAFQSDSLDRWQTLELEELLQPALSLLGYRPAGDLEGVARLRRDAEAYRDARAEAEALRSELQQYQRVIARAAATPGDADDEQQVEAVAREVATLHAEARRYEDALDELRQLRFQIRDQQDETPDIRTLRWKAKRYDQIRAAASPLLRIRRMRSGR